MKYNLMIISLINIVSYGLSALPEFKFSDQLTENYQKYCDTVRKKGASDIYCDQLEGMRAYGQQLIRESVNRFLQQDEQCKKRREGPIRTMEVNKMCDGGAIGLAELRLAAKRLIDQYKKLYGSDDLPAEAAEIKDPYLSIFSFKNTQPVPLS